MDQPVVYVGEPLYQFLNTEPERFGSVDGPDPGGMDLMSSIPWARAGYFVDFYTPITLIFNYIYRNGLLDPNDPGYIIPDDYMREYFAGDKPATFLNQGHLQKVLMGDAVNNGLVDEPLNTFQVIQRMYPQFDPNYFSNMYISDIVFYNCMNQAYVASHLHFPNYDVIYNNMGNNEVKLVLANERRMILAADRKWRQFLHLD